MTRFPPRNPAIACCLLLAAGTLLSLWPVLDAPFSGIDDPDYVTANPRVLQGLTPGGIAWAFTAFDAANYHPFAWISHMLDVTLFGPLPAGHHLTSLLLHVANVLLLFLFLRDATGAVRRSAFVAALFALHPMHVESVAWIAERKDVLCVFFSLLSLSAYVRYARKPDAARYAAVLLPFAAALLSKPMAVTLPFLMLVLDFWPLERAGHDPLSGNGKAAVSRLRLLGEKTPLFLLSAVSCALTLHAQALGGGLVLTLEDIPALQRFGLAAVAYVAYLGKLIWPVNLSIHYPLDSVALPASQVAAACGLLAAISLA
ncbi:MAG TPA: glycosyltransferase family 39 protein, partial [Candidatus Deferrimicrobiaceae bacterium]